MPRIGLTLMTLIVFAGCRAPGFDLFGLSGPDRVPPPPTGAIGGGYGGYGGYDSGYSEPVPRPNVGQGAANWPATDFAPASQFARNDSPSVPSRSAIAPPVASSRSTADLRPSLQPLWVDPLESRNAPGLLPPTGQTQPIATAPPRPRHFPNATGHSDVSIPEEMAHLQNNQAFGSGVRQATATSNWQR